MRPVFQTRYRRPEGNCLMACIASLLEIPLESCPDLHVAEQRGEHYWAVMADFVRARGFQPVWMTPEYLAGSVPIGYAAVAGRGARGDDHVCVAHDGRIVHDPLPYGGGLLDVKGWIVLVPVAALGPAASQNAGATPTDTPVEVDAQNSSSSSLLSPVEGRTNDAPPDPPHVREDYREVWLSGWRAGRAVEGRQPVDEHTKAGPTDVAIGRE